MITEEYLANCAAFRRMEGDIKGTYPYGHFVAIADETVVGDSIDFMSLRRALIESGRDLRKVIIVQAGHEYPERATIFGSWVKK